VHRNPHEAPRGHQQREKDRPQRVRGHWSAADTVSDRTDNSTSCREDGSRAISIINKKYAARSGYALADEVHVDVNFEVQVAGECVQTSIERANELPGRHLVGVREP